jgi:hypothetical protein
VAKAKVGNGYYLAVISSRHYNAIMERAFKKFSSFEEAEQYDIEYYIHLSVDQRQNIAGILKKRAYGDGVPDIRAYHKHK